MCFVISHDLRTTASADRIICLNRGKIAEQGTHLELLELGGVYARLYRLLEPGSERTQEVVDA